MKFSALSVDFSSPSPDPLASKRPAQAGVKNSYPLKVVSLKVKVKVKVDNLYSA